MQESGKEETQQQVWRHFCDNCEKLIHIIYFRKDMTRLYLKISKRWIMLISCLSESCPYLSKQ